MHICVVPARFLHRRSSRRLLMDPNVREGMLGVRQGCFDHFRGLRLGTQDVHWLLPGFQSQSSRSSEGFPQLLPNQERGLCVGSLHLTREGIKVGSGGHLFGEASHRRWLWPQRALFGVVGNGGQDVMPQHVRLDPELPE